MVDVSDIGNSARIKNIHTFLQGNNPLALSEDITKSALALEEACGELASSEQTKRARIEGSPQLSKPKMARASQGTQPESSVNSKTLFIETFSTIRRLLHEGNISELSNRLQLLNLESASLREQGKSLLDSFANSTEKMRDIGMQLVDVKEQLDLAKNTLAGTQNLSQNHQLSVVNNLKEITSIKKQLQDSEQRLAQINTLEKPITEAIYQEEVALEREIGVLTNKLTELTNEQSTLESTTGTFKSEIETLTQNAHQFQDRFEVLLDKEVELAKIADGDRQKLNTFMETTPRPVEVDGEKWENTLALLTMLTAQLKKAMGEDSIRNMKEQEEVMMKISEASRKDSDKKAKEAAESERKAAESNKAASCASKIFSYVLLAVSVIATVASFGTAAPLTLAIAAIGIAMSVADIVLEETGHGSLMQMLANEISSAVTGMLISFGVDEDKAKQIGSIVGMIVAAIAFLAISLLSMGSMIKNLVSTVKNAAQLLLKNVGSLLKNTIKAMPKSLTNALGNIATNTTKVTDSVADGADSMVKLSTLAKLSDKFDDASNIAKSVNQAASKVDKSSGFISLGGQMVKVSDPVADSADSVVKLTKLTKLADKFDDVKGVSKSANQVTNKIDDVSDTASSTEKLTKGVKSQSATMARVEVGMKATGAGLTVTNAATTGGLRLNSAAHIRDMKEMLAGMMLNNETIQSLTELLNTLIKAMSKNSEQFDEMFMGMMTSLKQSGDNKVDILKTARFA